MKKSLSKVLARMAKDGDIETVAEIIEEMIEPEGSPEPEAEPEETAPAIEEPAAVIETPEGTTVAVDETTLAEVVSRLDQIIALLTPAPAADSDPAEEIAEAVEEAMEAAAAAEPLPEAVSAAVEEFLDPVSSVIPEEAEEEEIFPETVKTGDVLRAALAAVRPVIDRMPPHMREKTVRDIAARLRRCGRRGTTGTDAYAALASARRRTAPASAELGRRIMEKRNVNYRD